MTRTSIALIALLLFACGGESVDPSRAREDELSSVEKPLKESETKATGNGSEATNITGHEKYPGDPVPFRPLPRVQINPLDLSTSVGESPIELLVDNLGKPVGSAALEAIAKSVRLVTWPEEQPVASTYRTVDTTGSAGEDAYAHVYIRPQATLEGRWYALVAPDTLPNAQWMIFSDTNVKGSTRYSRFRPDSQLIVTSIRVYEEGKGSTVYVDLSERVAGNVSGVSLQGATCKADTIREAQSTNSVRFVCAESVSARAVQLAIAPGVQSLAGKSLEPSAVDIDPSSWHAWGTGGKRFKPSL